MLAFWIFLVWLAPGVLLFVVLRRKSKRSPERLHDAEHSSAMPTQAAATDGGDIVGPGEVDSPTSGMLRSEL